MNAVQHVASSVKSATTTPTSSIRSMSTTLSRYEPSIRSLLSLAVVVSDDDGCDNNYNNNNNM